MLFRTNIWAFEPTYAVTGVADVHNWKGGPPITHTTFLSQCPRSSYFLYGGPKAEKDHNISCYKLIINDSVINHNLVLFHLVNLFRQDFLFVGAGPIPDESLLYSLSGTEVPGVVVGESSMMWMRFFSDDSMQYSGFKLTYTSLESKLKILDSLGGVRGGGGTWGSWWWI